MTDQESSSTNPMTRIWLDPAFTRKRWKTQVLVVIMNLVFTAAITTCAIGYLNTVETITPTVLTWPVVAIAMALCTNLATYSHCVTLKGFVDMTTPTPKDDADYE